MVFPYSSKPAIKISSAIPNIFGMPLKNSYIFFWNMSPARAALNGDFIYLYLSNGQENIVKYDAFSFSYRLG